MFLNSNQILRLLRTGNLVIDPLDKGQFGQFAVDLRLGTEIMTLPAPPQDRVVIDPERMHLTGYLWLGGQTTSLQLGERLVLNPGQRILATTLETLKMPANLAGLIYPRSSFSRIGLSAGPVIVDPGFSGKLVLSITNGGAWAISIYPGVRVAQIVFSHVDRSSTRIRAGKFSLRIPQYNASDDIGEIKKVMSIRAERLKSTGEPPTSISELLALVVTTEGREKGKALERLAASILSTIRGLKVIKINAHLKAEEIDIVVQNDIGEGFWRIMGSPLLVECKNWSERVGAREISVLSDKLRSISPDSKMGILVAPNGVSGSFQSDGILKIREKRQQGLYVIVLDRKDLEEIASGTHAAAVLDRKYGELCLI